MPRITCVGGANVDRKARSLQPIQYEESNPVTVIHTSGGVARNVSENLAQLGVATTLLTIVGDDHEGKWLLDEISKCGINSSPSFILPGERTGTYTAVLDQVGEMVFALADMQIFDKLSTDMLDSRWSYVASSELVMMDTNLSEEVVAFVMDRCRQAHLRLCINPVSAIKVKKLPKSLAGAELIVANQNEAEVFTGVSIRSVTDAQSAAGRLLEAGVKQAVITMGKKGAVWANQAGCGHLLPPAVQIVDVTGAGDALMAGILYGLIQNESLEEACRWGMNASALTIQTVETVTKLNPEQLKYNPTIHR